MINNDYIVRKVFRKYFFFSTLSAAAAPLGMMVDEIVIGNYLGKEAMAAAGLASPIYILLSAFSGIMASGSTSMCGQYIGKEQPDKVKGIFSSAMLWSTVMYFLCMVAFFCAPEQIAGLLGAKGTLLPFTADYIRGLAPGIGLCILHLTLVEFAKLDGSPALGAVSIVIMMAVNIVLDLVNVFWLHMGLLGIALGTSASYLTGVLICGIHFLRPRHTLKLVRILKPWSDLIKLVKSGLPRAGNGICFAVTTAFMNYRLVFLGGSVALAAFAIQSSVALVVGATCLGAGSSILLMSGIFYGEEDKGTLEYAMKASLREGTFITVLVCGLCYAFLEPVIGLFGQENSGVAVLATSAVSWKLLGLIMFTVNHVFVNYYQGTGNLKMANFVAIMEALPSQALYVAVLPFFMGVDGVWAAPIMGGITTFLSLTVVVGLHNKCIPRSLKEYLLFPKSFGVEASMQISVSIVNDMQEVMRISRQVYDFCEQQGIDAKRKHHLSLCVEEMAGNVVKYAFDNGKKHMLDIRIMRKGDQLLFRLRDDGKPFNPLDVLLEEGAEPGKNVGIHLVRKISSSIHYRHTIGLNNLLIKL